MLRRISSAFRGRALQAYQIAKWRRPKLSVTEQQDCNTARYACASVCTVLEAAISDLTPQEVGALYCVLRKCIIILSLFMIQNPTDNEISTFVTDLEEYAKSRSPAAGIFHMVLMELAASTLAAMRLEYAAAPEYAAALNDVRHQLGTYEQVCRACEINRKITTRTSLALFHASLPRLREEYSLKDMIAFTQGYRQEDRDESDHVPMPHSPRIEYNVDDTAAEYRGIGKRVELSTCCKPAASVPKHAECSVCMTEIDGAAQDQDEQAVTTKCEHMFHRLCLDKWVNDSGMMASNTCPLCRMVLCRPRERIHASAEVDSNIGSLDVSHTSVFDTSRIDTAVTVPSDSRVRAAWIERRIRSHLSLGGDEIDSNASSDSDDSSVASTDSEAAMTDRDIIDVLLAERFRVLDY